MQLEQLESAIDCFYEVLLFIKKNAQVYMARAIAQHKQGKLELALFDYSKAIELDPYFSEAYVQRAFCYSEMK